MKTATAGRAYERVLEVVTTKLDDGERTVNLEIGQAVRQGDVYVWRVPRVPKGSKRDAQASPQLAPGTTRGSRHIVSAETWKHIKAYRLAEPSALDGPVLVASQPWCLTHPEHGDFIFFAGTYRVRYQRQLADELRRVAD